MSDLNQLYSNYWDYVADSVDCLITQQSSNRASLRAVTVSNCSSNVGEPVYWTRSPAVFFYFQGGLSFTL